MHVSTAFTLTTQNRRCGNSGRNRAAPRNFIAQRDPAISLYLLLKFEIVASFSTKVAI